MGIKIPQYVGEMRSIDTDRGGMPRVNFGGQELKGRAIASLGNSISQLGSDLGSIAAKAQAKAETKENFEAQNAFNMFKLKSAQQWEKTYENAPPDGGDIHNQYMSQYWEPAKNEFLQRLPERLREKYAPEFEFLTEKWSYDTAKDQAKLGYKYYSDEIASKSEEMAGAIYQNPDLYNEYYNNGRELIHSSGLTQRQKYEAEAKWTIASNEARLQGMIDKGDPLGAIRATGGLDYRNMSHQDKVDWVWDGLIQQESGGNPFAVSNKGAVGLVQGMVPTAMMPGYGVPTIFDVAEGMGWKGERVGEEARRLLFNPKVANQWGKQYLNGLLQQTNGDVEAALIAYNGGMRNAKKWLESGRNDSVLPAETRNYYKSILAMSGMQPQPGASSLDTTYKGRTGELIWTDKAMRFGPISRDGVQKKVLNAAERASAIFGQPLKITSGFRGEQDNVRAGGARKSQHIAGNALDISMAHLSTPERQKLIQSLVMAGFTRVGVYSGNTGIHADMGDPKGKGVYMMFDGSAHNLKQAPAWFVAGAQQGLAVLKGRGGKPIEGGGYKLAARPSEDGSFATITPVTRYNRAIPEGASDDVITVKDTATDQWVNLPTNVDGQRLDEEEAKLLYKTGRLASVDGQTYASLDDAVAAAETGGITSDVIEGQDGMPGGADDGSPVTTGPVTVADASGAVGLPFRKRVQIQQRAMRVWNAQRKQEQKALDAEAKDAAKLQEKRQEVELRTTLRQLEVAARQGSMPPEDIDALLQDPAMVSRMYDLMSPEQIMSATGKIHAAKAENAMRMEMMTQSEAEMSTLVESKRVAAMNATDLGELEQFELEYRASQKLFDEEMAMRKNQPDKALLRQPEWQERWANEFKLDGDPAKNAALVEEFTDAQIAMGTPMDRLVPVPRDVQGPDGKSLFDSIGQKVARFEGVSDAKTASEKNALYRQTGELYVGLEKIFGDQVDEVISASLRKHSGIGRNVSKLIIEEIQNVASGGRPDRAMGDVRRRWEEAQAAKEADQLDRFLSGQPEEEPSLWGTLLSSIGIGNDGSEFNRMLKQALQEQALGNTEGYEAAMQALRTRYPRELRDTMSKAVQNGQ